jgi:hypothetical protein
MLTRIWEEMVACTPIVVWAYFGTRFVCTINPGQMVPSCAWVEIIVPVVLCIPYALWRQRSMR